MARLKRFPIRTRGYRPGTYGRRIAPINASRAIKFPKKRPYKTIKLRTTRPTRIPIADFIGMRKQYQQDWRTRFIKSTPFSEESRAILKQRLRPRPKSRPYKEYLKRIRRFRI